LTTSTSSGQPNLSETEHERTMRAAAVVDQVGFPADLSEPVKVLVGQFRRNPFINSGGARYLPLLGAETVLIEDFEEGQESAARDELLPAPSQAAAIVREEPRSH
jgi:hypothetical protein